MAIHGNDEGVHFSACEEQGPTNRKVGKLCDVILSTCNFRYSSGSFWRHRAGVLCSLIMLPHMIIMWRSTLAFGGPLLDHIPSCVFCFYFNRYFIRLLYSIILGVDGAG